jgi:DNA replication protein DnaC
VSRDIAAIDQGLRRIIRGLVAGEHHWPLFLHGSAGRGKTCAALCLLDYAGGEYWTAATLCAALIEAGKGQRTWSHDGRGGNVWPADIWRRIAQAPLVVLDEIGARERVSDHHYETVQRVLDDRSGKPLVAISNLDAKGIEAIYDYRIVSRLSAGTVLFLDGKDRRL